MSSSFPRLPGRPANATRASDQQRDAVCDTLAEHYALGAISLEEFERRAEAALHTEGHQQLVKMTRDLPLLPGQLPRPSILRIASWILAGLGTGVIAAALVMIGLGMLVFNAGHWWVIALIGVLFGVLSAGGFGMARRDAQHRRER